MILADLYKDVTAAMMMIMMMVEVLLFVIKEATNWYVLDVTVKMLSVNLWLKDYVDCVLRLSLLLKYCWADGGAVVSVDSELDIY